MKNTFKKNEMLLAGIASTFFLLYGITPFLLNEFGRYSIDGTLENLIFSIVAAFFPLLVSYFSRKYLNTQKKEPLEIGFKTILVIFFISLIVFHQYPWHDDRESLGASVSAIFRGVWLILVINCYSEKRDKRLLLMLLTIILMLVDQSRTAFGLALFLLGVSFSKSVLLFSVFLMTAAAAWRMGEGFNLLDNILYGLIGEGYNGAKGSLQSIAVAENQTNYFLHILQTFAQPFITIFQVVLSKVTNFNLDTTRHIGSLVEEHLGEIYSPMGGFYISAEFIYYGYGGLIILLFYLLMTYLITKKLFDNIDFPVGSLLFIISIKATPYVYWKYIIYLYIVQATLSWMLGCQRTRASTSYQNTSQKNRLRALRWQDNGG